MDDRYYSRRIPLDDSGLYMTIMFIDTTPCVMGYRNPNPVNWDPCSSQYPTCSLDNSNDDFEGKCMFHENVVSQDCSKQFLWFQQTLANVPADDWLVVVGHHPIDEVNVLDFTSALQAHGFSIYLNGHAHTLTQYTIDNKGAYVTSGAGSLVNTPDQLQSRTAAKLGGLDIEGNFDKYDNENPDVPPPNAPSSHTYQTKYNAKVAGFTEHFFSSDFATMIVNFVFYNGSIGNSFTVDRSGTIIS